MTKPEVIQEPASRAPNWALQQAKRVWNSATQRVMSVTGMGMVVALAVDVLLAARLGTSVAADALVIALSLPRLIEIVAREGTKFSLLAFFVEMDSKLPRQLYHRFVSGLLNLFLLAGIVLTLLGWLLAPQLVALQGPGLPPEGKAQATLLFRLTMPLTIFALSSTVLGILLNSQRHFVLVSARNGVAPTVVLLTIGLSWKDPSFSIWVAGAHTVGYALFFIIILWYSIVRLDFRPDWRAWLDRSTLQPVREAIAYPTLGYGVRQGARMIERMLASLVSVGGVSAYYYATRLVSAAQTLIGISFATTAMPSMAEYALAEKRARLARFLRKRLVQILIVSTPLALVMLIFSRLIMALLFGRGSFGDNSIEMSAGVLFWLAAGFVFACLVPLLYSAVYSLRDIKGAFFVIFQVAVINVALAVPLSILYGLQGLAGALSLTSLLSCIRIRWHLRKLGVDILSRDG
jgi:putative peptidoglycan lipid II flippase